MADRGDNRPARCRGSLAPAARGCAGFGCRARPHRRRCRQPPENSRRRAAAAGRLTRVDDGASAARFAGERRRVSACCAMRCRRSRRIGPAADRCAFSSSARSAVGRLAECSTVWRNPAPLSAISRPAAMPNKAARLSFLAESFDGVSARRWSPQDGTEALDQTGFDIILAVNACARLQLDANGFADLRKLLAPSGVFVAVEPEPNPLWDMVFGQNPGWWQAGSRASDRSPLRSAEEWRTELAAAGFRSADAAPSAWTPWPCAVFWGTAPPHRESSRSDPGEPRSVLVVAGDAALAAAMHDRLGEAGHRVTLAGQANAAAERIAGSER